MRRTTDVRRLVALVAGAVLTITAAPAPAQLPSDEAPRAAAASDDAVESVLAISIDGLNPDALDRLGRAGTPHLHALRDSGASTFNARTERELTITLPNHTGMVTGRRVEASTGGHGVRWNDDRRRPATVQAAAGGPVASVWTEVHAAGGSTALFASKTKFSLWKRSWPLSIDTTRIKLDNALLARSVQRDLRTTERDFRFVHLSLPDSVGHDAGFMSKPYLRAVKRVDALVGGIVGAVTSDPELAAGTVVIVTSDHGGLGDGHSEAGKLHNYRVPFLVSGPGVAAGTDLYELNPDYLDPGASRTTYADERQPVRNGALANLALDLLDLGAVPGSEHNSALDLDVSPTE
ncbi:alkaline phosphatase family protein [Nocardioides renjunii]|uniref:alkaline phosphatase family protein n=1 Tax=Nocardioides renjunii TaxID=3095075 RepID=UPI002AFFC820|nr:alkaline phosphatase family protein [Nocardioides sp. S-34]WQQ21257.1 alkaline phosphatase family protein [Nocardioides sp. S-34]